MLEKNIKSNHIDYFKNKKITLMGIGLLGRGAGDAQFLAEQGADLIITDLKTKEELKPSLNRLKKYKNIKYTLGQHKMKDFQNRDFILKSAGAPLDSPYIKKARENNIPIQMSASLLAKLSEAKIIGVTGTRGKSTVAYLIYEILKNVLKKQNKKVHLAGNIRGVANLPILQKIKKDDIIVAELDSWQLQGFGEAGISPRIAVFTTFLPDHLNYYKGDMRAYFQDKANIFKNQKAKDYLITNQKTFAKIKKYNPGRIKSKIIFAEHEKLPASWKTNLLGAHNQENIAMAIKAAQIYLGDNFDLEKTKKTVENFKPVSGRLEYVKSIKGIKIYNDNNATTPEATIAALRSLGKNIVLIMGGVDKGLDMSGLIKAIPKHCKAVVLFSESGTDKIKGDIKALKNIEIFEETGLKNCIQKALGLAKAGDIILYSPAMASFGKFFKNEFDRADQFMKALDKF